MTSTARAILVIGAIGTCTTTTIGGNVLFDQIRDDPFNATALSSSQFAPGMPEGAITTVDNFSVPQNDLGTPYHITQIEAAVAGVNNFVSFDLCAASTSKCGGISIQCCTRSGTPLRDSVKAPDRGLDLIAKRR